jgi:PPOX class probable F420-dependent enzyme
MPSRISMRVRRFIDAQRVARLATVGGSGEPSAVPVCYVFDGRSVFSAIDEKRKRAAPHRLQRVRNIEVNPRVALLVDVYDEDWSQLAYVLIHGTATVLEPAGRSRALHARAIAALRRKYPQYRAMKLESRPVIRIKVMRVRAWSAGRNQPARVRPA